MPHPFPPPPPPLPAMVLLPPLGKIVFTTVSVNYLSGHPTQSEMKDSHNVDGKLSPCLKVFGQHQELFLRLQLDYFFLNYFVSESLLQMCMTKGKGGEKHKAELNNMRKENRLYKVEEARG